MAEKYITGEQQAKCRKVADAFAELYELQNNQPMSREQQELAGKMIEELWEETR